MQLKSTWFAALLVSASALAHDVTPTVVSLRPGGEDFFYVADQFSCPATITATSLDPSAVKVYALDMNNPTVLLPGGGASATVGGRIDQVFIVRAQPGVAVGTQVTIAVCWVGSTAPDLPCPENNCNPPTPVPVIVIVEANPSTFGSTVACGIAGDPVTTDDGELFFEEPADLDLRGPLGLHFQRYYASRRELDANVTGTLGPNWSSNFDWRLFAIGSTAEVRTPTGRVIVFERGYAQSAWQQALYTDQPFQLVSSGASHVLIDPRTGVARTFDVNGNLQSIADGKGNVHALTVASPGPSQVTDGLGRTLSFTYASNRLVSVNDGTRAVLFGYTGGVLTSVTDAAGKVTSYAYDAAFPGEALLVSRTRPEGNVPWTQTYDSSRRVDAQSDAKSNTTSLAFHATNGETTLVNPLGDSYVHDHSADSELTRIDDETGDSATLAYDAHGRRKSITDRRGATTSWTFHAASGQLATITEANGVQTAFAYELRSVAGGTAYDLRSITHPGGASESFEYDAQGNLTGWIDAAGHGWSTTYNTRGQAMIATNPAGGVTNFTYNADGTLATTTDPASNVTSFGYDALRRLTTVTQPDTSTVTYTYDALDRITSVTDELSRTTSFTWDDNSNLVAVTRPTNETWLFAYDAMDRLTSVTDPLGNASTATFDELGRVASLENGAGDTLGLTYDARGRLVGTTDGKSNAWSASYDDEGVLAGVIDPLTNATSVTTDSMGRPTAITSPLGARTQLAYDARGNVKQLRDPAGNATNYTFDERGALASVAAPGGGGTTALERNALGRVTELDGPGAADWSFAYDAQGLPTSRTDPLARTTSYTHDVRGRVDEITLPGALGTLDATWDAANRLTRLQGSDGVDVQLGYDEEGRLTSAPNLALTYEAGEITESNGLVLTRDAAQRVTSVEVDPGKTITYAYDERGLLTSISDWIGGATTFAYDAAGRLISIARPNGVTTSYSYDADSRITRIAEELDDPLTASLHPTAIAEVHINWNVRGQIIELDEDYPLETTPDLGTQSYTYDAGGQTNGWEYDELGRLLHRDEFWINEESYWANWDTTNRAVRLRVATVVLDYQYDAFGDLGSRTRNATTESYVRNYAFARRPICTVRVNGNAARYYVHTPAGGLVYGIDAATDTRHFFHFDARLWTRFLTDENGAITDSYAYTLTGAESASQGATNNPFRAFGYIGGVRETAALVHVFGRILDGESGRYLDRGAAPNFDPIAANAYQFDVAATLRYATAQAIAPVTFARSTRAFTSAEVLASLNLYGNFVYTQDGFRPSGSERVGPATSPDIRYGSPQTAGFDLAELFEGDFSAGLRYHGEFAGFPLAHAVGYATRDASAAPVAPASVCAASAAPENYRELVAKLRKRYPMRLPIVGRLIGGDLASMFGRSDGSISAAMLAASTLASSPSSTLPAPETVLLGGTRREGGGIPVLSNLPVMSRLFRTGGRVEQGRRLLVLINPSIVREATQE